MRKKIILMCLAIMLINIFAGCFGKKYSVDYEERKDDFSGAKDSYRAGSTVRMYFNDVGTDTDYAFYLDGEKLNALYKEGKGYAIVFTMPEHDVRLTYTASSSMMSGIPEIRETYTVTADMFDGNEGEYRPGDTVRLTIGLATDTNYKFYIDGEQVQPDYEDYMAVIEFTMPEHDVVVGYTSKNSMVVE